MSPPPATIASVATAELRDAAVGALVEAFAEDPAWTTALPEPRTRRSVLRSALSALSADTAGGRTLLVGLIDGEVVGAAVGWPPDYHPSPFRTPRYLTAAVAIFRDAGITTVPLWRRWHALRAADPTGERHWHLAALGVRPDAQRRGVGRALLEAFLERVDGGGDAAYLETSRPDILAWYGAVGFGVRERLSLPGGRTAWTMWRPPTPMPRQPLPSGRGAASARSA